MVCLSVDNQTLSRTDDRIELRIKTSDFIGTQTSRTAFEGNCFQARVKSCKNNAVIIYLTVFLNFVHFYTFPIPTI